MFSYESLQEVKVDPQPTQSSLNPHSKGNLLYC